MGKNSGRLFKRRRSPSPPDIPTISNGSHPGHGSGPESLPIDNSTRSLSTQAPPTGSTSNAAKKQRTKENAEKLSKFYTRHSDDLSVSDQALGADLPRQCPMPTDCPFTAYWWDAQSDSVRTLTVSKWQNLPTADEIKDLDPESFYWSLLFYLMRKQTDKYLRFLRRQVPSDHETSWDAQWKAFKTAEAALSRKPADQLVRPSGRLDAKLLVLSHYPTFSTIPEKFRNGEVLDPDNCCMQTVFRKLREHGRVLHVDMYSRRVRLRKNAQGNRSGVTMDNWSRALRNLHLRFSMTLDTSCAAKAIILNGKPVLEQWSDFHGVCTDNKRFKTIRWYMETCQEPMSLIVEYTNHGEIKRLIFPSKHPEALLHPYETRNTGRAFDDMYNMAALVAGIPSNLHYGEAKYYIRCGNRASLDAMMSSLTTNQMTPLAVSCQRRILQMIPGNVSRVSELQNRAPSPSIPASTAHITGSRQALRLQQPTASSVDSAPLKRTSSALRERTPEDSIVEQPTGFPDTSVSPKSPRPAATQKEAPEASILEQLTGFPDTSVSSKSPRPAAARRQAPRPSILEQLTGCPVDPVLLDKEASEDDPVLSDEESSEDGWFNESYPLEDFSQGDSPEDNLSEDGWSNESYPLEDFSQGDSSEDNLSEDGWSNESYPLEDFSQGDSSEDNLSEDHTTNMDIALPDVEEEVQDELTLQDQECIAQNSSEIAVQGRRMQPPLIPDGEDGILQRLQTIELEDSFEFSLETLPASVKRRIQNEGVPPESALEDIRRSWPHLSLSAGIGRWFKRIGGIKRQMDVPYEERLEMVDTSARRRHQASKWARWAIYGDGSSERPAEFPVVCINCGVERIDRNPLYSVRDGSYMSKMLTCNGTCGDLTELPGGKRLFPRPETYHAAAPHLNLSVPATPWVSLRQKVAGRARRLRREIKWANASDQEINDELFDRWMRGEIDDWADLHPRS